MLGEASRAPPAPYTYNLRVLAAMSATAATKYQVLLATTGPVSMMTFDPPPRWKKRSLPAPPSPRDTAKPPELLWSSARMRWPASAWLAVRIHAVIVKLLLLPRLGKADGSATYCLLARSKTP
jgi:hypothetical protein